MSSCTSVLYSLLLESWLTCTVQPAICTTCLHAGHFKAEQTLVHANELLVYCLNVHIVKSGLCIKLYTICCNCTRAWHTFGQSETCYLSLPWSIFLLSPVDARFGRHTCQFVSCRHAGWTDPWYTLVHACMQLPHLITMLNSQTPWFGDQCAENLTCTADVATTLSHHLLGLVYACHSMASLAELP